MQRQTPLHLLAEAFQRLADERAQPGAEHGDFAGFVDLRGTALEAAAQRALRVGELAASRVGRALLVDRAELRRWIEAHRVAPSRAVAATRDAVAEVIDLNRGRRRTRAKRAGGASA